MLPPTAPLPASIAEADKLPTPPAVAVEVARLSRLDTTVVDDLGAVIARDPALAARLLRVVNSAANGLSGSIDSIPRACSMLGLHQTRDLALGFAISDNLPVVDASSGFDLEQYWTRSSMTAAAARSVALRVRPGYADTAFVLGLLSELGRLVMAAVVPDEYRPLLMENRWPTPTQERARLGYSNLEISAGLMSHWKLPEELVLPIAYRDRPQELGPAAPAEVVVGCRIVSTARLISDVWYAGADSRAMQWAASGAGSYLGLEPGRFQEILEDLQAEVDGGGHGSFAHIQPPDIVDMAKIQREAAEKIGRVVAQGRKTSLLLNLLKQQPQD
jgi:HD-like signal output (HDOD) protein